MTITTLFQRGIYKLFILGLVAVLAACGGGGGKGKSKSQAAVSQTAMTSSALNSSFVANSTASSAVSSSVASSSISSLTQDTTPNTFSYTPVTGAAPSASVTSPSIAISGINTATPISVTGGQYAISNGALTSDAGTITNGQTVTVTLIASATLNTTTHAVLSVGGVTATFSVTTRYLIGGAIQGGPLNVATVVTTLAGGASVDGLGTAARLNNPLDAVSDGTNLYIADTGHYKIRKIVIATGVVTTVAGGSLPGYADGVGTAASFGNPTSITTDGTNLYITDENRIRKIVISTGVVTTLAGTGTPGNVDGTGTSASFSYPEGITTDGTNLYVADMLNSKIRKLVIATGAVTTLAGSGSRGSADGTGTAASFFNPKGITTDGTNLYIADMSNNKIRKIVIATGVVTTLAGSVTSGNVDGTGTSARFLNPGDLTSDGIHLYVADTGNNSIRKIVMLTGVVTTLAGSVSSGNVDGTGTAASFNTPVGITGDGASLYIADTNNDKIRKIVISTGVVTTLAGSQSAADGTGAVATFKTPSGITTDGNDLYIADTDNHNIRKIVISTGVVTTLAGTSTTGNVDGTGTSASFRYPKGVTTDGVNLYIAEDCGIRKVVIATAVVTRLAGNFFCTGIDGTGTDASFTNPNGITTDGNNVYITDSNKIRKIVIATGVVTTLAGGSSSGSADGTGTAASFVNPKGITTDGNDLYIADTYNQKIRKIVIATGVVTTLAGSGSGGTADGTGTAASFFFPEGITTDGTNLYVADTSNNSIRKIVIATGDVTTLAGGISGNADGTGTMASFKYPQGIITDGFDLFVTDSANNTIRKIH